MSEYYAITRSSEWLRHEGKKGMRWGIRKDYRRLRTPDQISPSMAEAEAKLQAIHESDEESQEQNENQDKGQNRYQAGIRYKQQDTSADRLPQQRGLARKFMERSVNTNSTKPRYSSQGSLNERRTLNRESGLNAMKKTRDTITANKRKRAFQRVRPTRAFPVR